MPKNLKLDTGRSRPGRLAAPTDAKAAAEGGAAPAKQAPVVAEAAPSDKAPAAPVLAAPARDNASGVKVQPAVRPAPAPAKPAPSPISAIDVNK